MTKFDPLLIGVEVLKRRKLARLSQAELAKRAGVGAATVARTECGSHTPDILTLLRLARALGCQLGDLTAPLVHGDDPSEPVADPDERRSGSDRRRQPAA